MLIGDRRTKHTIRAFRSPAHMAVMPKNATLHNVRTSSAFQGHRCSDLIRDMARRNPNLHIFEYRGETLYMHFVHGLIEATTEIKSE
jgi:hypothetical protein